MRYQVEKRDPDTGEWDVAHRCQPAYKYKIVTKGWWFWRRDVKEIVNRREAEADSRRRAVMLARAIWEVKTGYDSMYREVTPLGRARARPSSMKSKMTVTVRKTDVRIVKYSPLLGGEWTELIWENGVWVE